MRLRELKRAVCLILAFLMLSGSAGPVPSTAWAAAFEDLQEVSSQSDESSSEQKEEKEEKNASSDEQKGGDSGSSDEQKGGDSGSSDEQKGGESGSSDEQKDGESGPSDEQKGGESGPSDEQKGGESASSDEQKDGDSTSSDEQKGGDSGSSDEQKDKETSSDEGDDKAQEKEETALFRTIFFQPNTTWTEGSVRFAAVVSTMVGESWIDGTDPEQDGRLEFQIPSDATEFCFVRLNADQTENEWQYVQNQTEKLTLPVEEDLDLFTLDEEQKEKEERGTWSNAEKTPLPNAGEAAPALRKGPAALVSSGLNGTVRLQGEIKYAKDTIGDIAYGPILQPQTFDQTLAVVPIYTTTTGEGETATVTEVEADPWILQSTDPRGDHYVQIKYGPEEGEVHYDIVGLPKTITVNNQEKVVQKYRVIVHNPQPDCYEQKSASTTEVLSQYEGWQTGDVRVPILDVELGLILCPLVTITSQVDPDDTLKDEPDEGIASGFKWDIAFELPDKWKNIDAAYGPGNFYYDEMLDTKDYDLAGANTESFVYYFPVGFKYKITQKPREGYILADKQPEWHWEGEIGTEPITISSVNYPTNMSLPFFVNWTDNNDTAGERPKDLSSVFVLQVREVGSTDDGDWVDFPAATDTTGLLKYGITGTANAPKLERVTPTGNRYKFTGLPGILPLEEGKNVQTLEYRVKCVPPTHYSVAENNEYILRADSYNDRKFTLFHSADFKASIVWMDDNNSIRPTYNTETNLPDSTFLNKLHLYKRFHDDHDNAVLEDITNEYKGWTWTQSGSTWNLTVPDLRTYTDDKKEIEYFLVFGSVNTNTGEVTSENIVNERLTYTAYYDNGSGSYASDTKRCFQDGKITMLLSSTEQFSTRIEWKDAADLETDSAKQKEIIQSRPSTTVTLWRYANDETLTGLDDAFQHEAASMVVYHVDGSDKPLSFVLEEGSQSATLTAKLDEGTVVFSYVDSDGTSYPGEPIHLSLPGHDNHGKKYTYFLRETLTGDNKDNYRVTYTGSNSTSYDEGAPEGGIVTNIRQEKALVTVAKTWYNPEGLDTISGAEVQLALWAKTSTGNMEELKVYNPQEGSYDFLNPADTKTAQTVTDFTATIPTSQTSYYVNLYDDQGHLYDMTHAMTGAKLVETVKLKNSDTPILQAGKTITLKNNEIYDVRTVYDPARSNTSADAKPKSYHYDQINTISTKRKYELEKIWNLTKFSKQNQTDPYLSNIEAVVMTLKRCLQKDLNTNPSWQSVYEDGSYVLVKEGSQWKTTLDNLDKYDENGNAWYYSAEETGFLVKDTTPGNTGLPTGASVTTITVSGGTDTGEKTNFVSFDDYSAIGWGHSYLWSDGTVDETDGMTTGKTTVTNYDEPGTGHFSITKNWKDNNERNHLPVTIRIYNRTELYNAIQGKQGDLLWKDLDTALITPTDNNGTPDIVLSQANGYSINQRFESLGNSDQNASINEYVVLEYKVGDSTVEYTYEAIAALAYNPPASSGSGESSSEQSSTETSSGQNSSESSTIPASDFASGTANVTDSANHANDRSYNVTVTRNEPRNTYYILNERTGTTHLTLTKTWNDDNNKAGLRPDSITFKLFRDREPCNITTAQNSPTCDAANVVITPKTDGTFTATYTGDGQNTAGTWTITISNLPMFSSESGMLYAYNIDEQNDIPSLDSNPDVHYVQSRGGVTSGTDSTGTTQKFNISLQNTVVGTTKHIAYKYWKDKSVTEKSLRPELILTLYRYVGSLAEDFPTLPENPTFDDLNKLTADWTDAQKKELLGFEKVTDHDDPVMTPNAVNSDTGEMEKGASGQYYDWKITINDLQRFDNQGREYVYVLREQMTNDGAVKALGADTYYKGKTVRTVVTEGNADVPTGEYDEFTNTITASRTLSGVKTWRGHEQYSLTSEDLPEPTITLYRTTYSSLTTLPDLNGRTNAPITNADIAAYLKNGQIEKVDEINLTGEYQNRYAFPSAAKIAEYAQGSAGAGIGTSKGDGNPLEGSGTSTAGASTVPLMVYQQTAQGGQQLMLPKYDAEGQLYSYLLRETLPNDDIETLYAKTSDSGTLVNTLNDNVNRREITVHKYWDHEKSDVDNFTQYHSLTFNLYRYLQKEGVDSVDPTRPYASKVFTAQEVQTMMRDKNECEYTFTDLLVLSPTGKPYGYFVTEKAIDGYQTILSKNINFSDSKNLSDAKDLVFEDTTGWKKGTLKNELYVKNTYEPEQHQLTLEGGKVWDDWHDEASVRPEKIDITLYRTTDPEKLDGNSQNNHIVSHSIDLEPWDGTPESKPTDPWIQWTKENISPELQEQYKVDGRDLWTYKIGGLTKYAPNGMPYIYTLIEHPIANGGYVKPSDVSGKAPDNSDTLNLGALWNKLPVNYSFYKYWHDGSNIYHLRPDSITVVLQYATSSDNGTTWSNWQDVLYKSGKYELYDKDHKRTGDSVRWESCQDEAHSGALSVVLKAETDAVRNTKENTWTYTFKNLPSVRKDANGSLVTVKYRCIEVKLGKAKVAYVDGNQQLDLGTTTNEALTSSAGFEVGAYKAKYESISDTSTEVANTLDATNLKLTKVWEGDSQNQYQSRPDYLTFRLERRGRAESGSSPTGTLAAWSPVKVPDENGDMVDFTFKVYQKNQTDPDKWEYSLKDLPVSGTDENGETFYTMEYRAVEVHDPENSTTVQGAKNYVDQMVYNDEEKDGHIFDPNASERNASTITNKLTTLTTSIKAEKVWYASDDVANTDVKATFELQYRLKGSTNDADWKSYTTEQTKATCSKTANGESNKQTVEWTGLPQYNLEGKELEYRIIESSVPNGYVCNPQNQQSDDGIGIDNSPTTAADGTVTYHFSNVKLQDYAVSKTWNKPDVDEKGQGYVPDHNGSFTSQFVLYAKIGENGTWAPVSSAPEALLTGNNSHTWENLPQYTHNGEKIFYKAVETQINGNPVPSGGSSDGNYIVTYSYNSGSAAPAFNDTQTNATNRLVYGFVNLSKEAAYLDPNGTPIVKDTNVDLSDVEFKIQKRKDNSSEYEDYATGIFTDANGNLNHTNGKYGTEQRYLVSGTYKLVEVSTKANYSRWATGVDFIVGTNGGNTDTGEHGTAWIYTDTAENKLTLRVSYEHPSPPADGHSFGAPDTCAPATGSADAFNLESRGVIEFTKKGLNGANLDTHSGSSGESDAYFGVYTDANCTDANQVAGMTATDGVTFVLTNKAQDGTKNLTIPNNTDGIPYLRSYGSGFTLLSGTYYVKELVPPAGYQLDTTVRTVTIAPLETTAMGADKELSSVYGNNKGKFILTSGSTTSYEWPNTPNSVKLYKLDQFGRNVTLKNLTDGSKGYLELKFDGGNFPTGEDTIRLYQDKDNPAKNKEGTTPVGNENGKWSITFDQSTMAWTITGLFDAEKSYTLSEPAEVVPDDNIQAKPITFTINLNGEMSVNNTDTHTVIKDSNNVLKGNGAEEDYKNYYYHSSSENIVVLRDAACIRKNVALKKIDSNNSTIKNIFFDLYKVSNGTTQKVNNEKLITNENGEINLLGLTENYTNSITLAPLCNGLDLGSYYFEELEWGASDGYRLAEKIYFSIVACNPTSPNPSIEDYAEVKFDTTNNSAVTQSGDCGTVTNTPVSSKSLMLTKQDGDGTTPLPGARFKLEYVSKTDNTPDSKTSGVPSTTYAMTGATGSLLTAMVSGDTWTIGTNTPDISAKGTYTLTEIQAPSEHSTYTDSGLTTTPAMVSFLVDSDNEIKFINGKSSYILEAFSSTGLVTSATSTTGADGDLTVTVKNNKTVVTIAKRNDLSRNITTKDQHDVTGEPLTGAELKIYEGTNTSGTPISTLNSTASTTATGVTNNGGNSWTLTGVLSENTVYTLHEESAPVGYKKADDLYFCLFGTRGTDKGGIESQLYVWTGSATPTAAVNALSTPDDNWSKVQNLDGDNDLTMVDEAIIVPVNARKVLDNGASSSSGQTTALGGAEFDVCIAGTGGAKLGTAVSDANGYLKWQSLEDAALSNRLVYIVNDNNKYKRITDKSEAVEKPIILQQNAGGYTFQETKAPDGYVLNPNHVTFTISSTETVQVNNADVTEVTLKDKPIKVTLAKYGEDLNTPANGAEYDLTPESGSTFVDGTTESIHLAPETGSTATNTLEIPTRTLIGGHSYVLKEMKAPDGYEATAVIHFKVNPDGSVTITNTTGGHRATVGAVETCCTAENVDTGHPGEYESTLKIQDEKIRVTLTKLGVDGNKLEESLNGVEYKLTPYGEESRFNPNYTHPSGASGTYSNGVEFTATTSTTTSGETGVINIPDGLLVHGCKYLLQEISIPHTAPNNLRYYLGKEASGGVILHVSDDDGTKITVERTSTDYTGDCPVTAADPDANGNVALTAKNPKAAVFEFTKSVSGNMGDVTGSFEITMEVYEPDGVTPVGDPKKVTLQNGQKYNSETGKLDANGTVKDASCKFDPNAIPVNAILVIKENTAEDYKAVIANIKVVNSTNNSVVADGTGATLLPANNPQNGQSEVSLRLDKDVGTNGTDTIQFTLTNHKDVAIDVGVALEKNAPYALITVLIPAVWLYLRSRRRRRDGDDE